MRYTFVNDGDKERLLKKYYRRSQVVIGTGITAVIMLASVFPAYFRSHPWCILPFAVYFIAFALYDGSSRRKDGIDSLEFRSYMWRQPMMIILQIIMAICVVVRLVQVFISK